MTQPKIWYLPDGTTTDTYQEGAMSSPLDFPGKPSETIAGRMYDAGIKFPNEIVPPVVSPEPVNIPPQEKLQFIQQLPPDLSQAMQNVFIKGKGPTLTNTNEEIFKIWDSIATDPDAFLTNLSLQGQSPDTEKILQSLVAEPLSPQTVKDFFTQDPTKILFAKALPNVLSSTGQTPDNMVAYFQKNPQQLRLAVVAQGRNPDTENLVKAQFPNISDRGMADYFQKDLRKFEAGSPFPKNITTSQQVTAGASGATQLKNVNYVAKAWITTPLGNKIEYPMTDTEYKNMTASELAVYQSEPQRWLDLKNDGTWAKLRIFENRANDITTTLGFDLKNGTPLDWILNGALWVAGGELIKGGGALIGAGKGLLPKGAQEVVATGEKWLSHFIHDTGPKIYIRGKPIEGAALADLKTSAQQALDDIKNVKPEPIEFTKTGEIKLPEAPVGEKPIVSEVKNETAADIFTRANNAITETPEQKAITEKIAALEGQYNKLVADAQTTTPKGQVFPDATLAELKKITTETDGLIKERKVIPKVEGGKAAPKPVSPTEDALNKFGEAISGRKTSEAMAAQQELWTKERAFRSNRFSELLAKEQASGADAATAIKNATAAFAGEYPRVSTGLTIPEEVRDAAYQKIIDVINADTTIPGGMKPFEITSTKTALDNALMGKPIPAIPGIKGGSAKSRLLRIFDSNPDIKGIIENPEATAQKILDSFESGAGVDAATADYLRNLPNTAMQETTGMIPPSEGKGILTFNPTGQLGLGQNAQQAGFGAFTSEPLRITGKFPTKAETDQATLELILDLTGTPKGATRIAFPPDKNIRAFSMLPLSNRELVIKALKAAGLNVIDAFGIPKATVFSLDASMMSRQLGVSGARHPISWIKTWKPYFKAMASDKVALEIDNIIRTEPASMNAIQKLGLDLYDIKPGASYWNRPETMASKIAEKYIPGVRMSNRGAGVAVNYYMSDVGKGIVKVLDKMNATSDEYKAMGSLLNELVGRGEMPKELRGTAGQILNDLLSSPRYTASRFEWPTKLVSGSKATRQEAWSTAFAWVGVNSAILGGAIAAGKGMVEGDPRSSDVIKLKIGDKRIDLWQGGAQILRMFAQLAPYVDEKGKVDWTMGSRKLSNGNIVPVPRSDILGRFIQSKESPGIGALTSLLSGKNYVGKKLDFSSLQGWGSFLEDTFAPASFQEIWTAYNLEGTGSAALSVTGLTGVGVNTYPSQTETNLRERGLYQPSEQLPNALSKELERLNISFGAVSSKIRDVELTDEQKKTYQDMTGKEIRDALEKLIVVPDFWVSTDEERKKLIDGVVTKARDQAQSKMYESVWTANTPEELQTKMTKMVGDIVGKLGTLDSPTADISHKADYNTISDMSNSLRTTLEDVPLSSLKDPPAIVKWWYENEKTKATNDSLSHVTPANLNADSKKDGGSDTYVDLSKQFHARLQLIAQGEDARFTDDKGIPHFGADAVVAFNRQFTNADEGNFPRRLLPILDELHHSTAQRQKEILEQNPELTSNPQQDYLVSNPKANASLVLSGQGRLLTVEAYNEYQKLIKDLDIVDEALPVGATPDNLPIFMITAEKNYREVTKKIDAMAAITDDKAREKAVEELKQTVVGKDDVLGQMTYKDLERKVDVLKVGLDTPKDTINAWVERGRLGDQTSPSSAESKLWLVDHPDIQKWALDNGLLTDTGKDWNIPSLRITAQYRNEDKAYDALPTTGTARADYLKNNPLYADARIRRVGYDYKLNDQQVQQWADYNHLSDTGYWKEHYRIDHPEFETAMKGVMGTSAWQPLDPKKIPSPAYDEITQKYSDLFTQYADAQGTEAQRAEIRKNLFDQNPAFKEAYYLRDGYKLLLDDKNAQNYQSYMLLPSAGWARERFLATHREFYGIIKTAKEWTSPEPKWNEIPTEKVEGLYNQYTALPDIQKVRQDFRAANPELDDWMFLTKKVTKTIAETKRISSLSPRDKFTETVFNLQKDFENEFNVRK